VECAPAACGCCGADLGDAAVIGVQKRQVFEASPPPPPTVVEYQVQAKVCGRCGTVTEGVAPAHATGRVQYGPLVHAKSALAVCAHYLPVGRAAALVASLTGVKVPAGFMAGVRGKAASRLEPFMDRVRELLRSAGVLYADETPARAGGHLHYVHVACTEFLTAMHTGDRTSQAIDAGGILPRYAGTIVRDGYKGYEHLTGALHAWCGAHGLRDLAGLYRFDPDGQVWARSMADLLIDANATATAARSAGQGSLSDAGLAHIRSWYRGAVAKGIADNQAKRTQIAKDGLRLARRFRDHEDMILRFATDLTVGFTSNQAERDIRPVKVQQRTSGGTWRTLLGLADFAIVQSYLSTAAKWGLDALDALTRLFTDGPWLPPATAPP
jgi:transposase